jgi:hypothetical protein
MKATDQTRDPCDKPQQRECSDARNARSFSDVPKVETPLDADQQAAGGRSADV